MYRTHTCGELRAEHVKQEVTVCGWVDTVRDMGGAVFVDLRDRYGKTQVVFALEHGAELVEQAKKLRSEDVVGVTGEVAPRPSGTVNPKLETGEVEVRAAVLRLFNPGNNPPFTPGQADLPGEDLR